jgi:hypothetical protein
MKGVYTDDIKISGLSAAKTLLYITNPGTVATEIISASVGGCGANVTNQQLEVQWQRITTIGTPTATAITPTPQETGDQAAKATVGGNVTASEPTYTAGAIFDHQGYASLAGYQHNPVPEERIIVPPGASIGLKMISTPAAFDCVVKVVHREIG